MSSGWFAACRYPLSILTLICLLSSALSAPYSNTDTYVSRCKQVSSSLTPKRWSLRSTWPSGKVPGVGSERRVDAIIPCGQSIIIDVPSLELRTLIIRGLLQVRDSRDLPLVHVRANYVIVEGQLSIGTASRQFSQNAIIELTPNLRNDRAPYQFTSIPPADPSNPRSFGHKAFVVVGGQLSLHGLPSNSDPQVWCRLTSSLGIGRKSIAVDCDATSWPIGGYIAVASTDYDRSQTEKFVIKSVKRNGKGTVIGLGSTARYLHYGARRGLSDGFGGFVNECAEVALLTRNIKVMGTMEGAPYNLEGGHMMVYMTARWRQTIEGVEFVNMGQQGTLGRYPIHFHIMGDVGKTGTMARKNSVHESSQRCVVVHATHGLIIDQNVAFNTSGHCFMTEEGGERDNVFTKNLGMLTRPVKKLISVNGPNPPLETDSSPSTFWLTNAFNPMIGNVAAGSADSGFWFEMVRTVRGNSASIPSISSTIPFISSPKVFKDNVAHSNRVTGLRTYPFGMRPRRLPGFTDDTPGVIERFTAYKNGFYGMFIHNTDLLIIKNSTFADNLWGIHLNQDARVSVIDSLFVAVTTNVGTPSLCNPYSPWPPCRRPSSKCKVMGDGWAPTYGVVIDQGRAIDLAQSITPNVLRNLRFARYDPTCNTAASIALMGEEKVDFWNPSHNSGGLRFTRDSKPIWLAPRISQINPYLPKSDGGEQAMFYTLYDKDGSLVGRPGYVVANTRQILSHGCTLKPKWNAYVCPGACYRTVMIAYPEAGFTKSNNNKNNKHGDYSYLKVTRISDSQVLVLDGNLQSGDFPDPVQRYYFMTLLASDTYRIEVVPSSRNPNFYPVKITVQYGDSGECGKGFSLQFKQNPRQAWIVPQSLFKDYRQCPGVSSSSSSDKALFQLICIKARPWVEVYLSPDFVSTFTLVRGTDSVGCPVAQPCSIIWSGSSWLYDASGNDRQTEYKAVDQASWWKKGTAPLGRNYNSNKGIVTVLPSPSGSLLTYYFRRSFIITRPSCYSSLILYLIANDGAAVFLNGVEVVRENLPSGSLTRKTLALSTRYGMVWVPHKLPLSGARYSLRTGSNYIAAEVHVHSQYGGQTAFDMRLTAVKSKSCSS